MSGNVLQGLSTVGVVAKNSTGYIEEMLGALSSGFVSVPLRHEDDTERLERTATKQVRVPNDDWGWIDFSFRSTGGDRPAMISFTSGTEGAAKAVLLSYDALNDVVERVTDTMEITPEIREYIGVPVYHSFGYGRARICLNAGGNAYIPQSGFDLREIRRMLIDDEINAISAVPSLWRVFLNECALFGAELEKVRWVEIGSQYMPANEKKALREKLPNAKIVQHYGLTEASRTTLQRIHEEPEELLGSVGFVQGNVDIRINAEDRIEIRGPHVALGIDDGNGYHAIGPMDWFQTSDRGRIENDRLWFEGRADDVINCGGIKLAPEMVEADVRRRIGLSPEFAVLRHPDPLRGEGVTIALGIDAASHRQAIEEAVVEIAQSQGAAIRSALRVIDVADFPRTATGKLQRRQLEERLAINRNSSIGDPQTEFKEQESSSNFLATVQQIMGAEPADQSSFLDMGGDSLAHMQMQLALERALGDLPDSWEAVSLRELAEKADAAVAMSGYVAVVGETPPLPSGDRNMNPSDLGFWELVSEDFRTNDRSIFHQGFLMLFIHRFGNWRMGVRPKLLRAPLTIIYRVLNKLTQILFGMKLDYTVKVGRRVKLEHFGGMILGAREIGDDVFLRQNTTLGIRSTHDLRAKPIIGSRVDIGAGAVIVGNIRIGENSIVGANTVVFTNVPPNSVIMGVPGKIIGKNPRRNPSPLKGWDEDVSH